MDWVEVYVPPVACARHVNGFHRLAVEIEADDVDAQTVSFQLQFISQFAGIIATVLQAIRDQYDNTGIVAAQQRVGGEADGIGTVVLPRSG